MIKLKWALPVLLIGALATVTYGGNHGYKNYYEPSRIIVRDKVVEYDADRFLGAYGYYQIADEIKEKVEQEKLSDQELKLLILEREIQLLKLKLQGKDDGMPHDKENEEPKEPEIPQDKYSKLTQLFTSRCVQCHKTNEIDLPLLKNGVANTELSLAKMVKVEASTFFDEHAKEAGLTRMPKGQPALKDEEISLIRKWVLDKALAE